MTPAHTQLTQPPPSGPPPSPGSRLPAHGRSPPSTAGALPDDVDREYGGGAASPAVPQPPLPRAALPRQNHHTRLKSQATIRLATHNVNGYASTTGPDSNLSKWTAINRTMLTRRIAVAALQETHLTAPRLDVIHRLFSKRLLVLSSSDPDNPGASAGVSFVINKDLIQANDYRFVELIPGRAIALTIQWYDSDAITLLNVYGPNQPTRHPVFWRTLRTAWDANHLPRPDFMLGDYNVIEDGLDRAPAHPDANAATAALMGFRTHFHLQDTWRHTHPDERTYTHRSRRNNDFSLSRLDRIYTSQAHADNVFEWEHDPTCIYSDHSLVCVRFAPHDAPQIGKGRWTLPLYLIDDATLLSLALTESARFHASFVPGNVDRTPDANPQTAWASLKSSLALVLKKYAKTTSGKIKTTIAHLVRDAAALRADPAFSTSNSLRTNEALLTKRIEHLQKKRYKTARRIGKARWSVKGERVNKYWFSLNKEKKPRDHIKRLHLPGTAPPTYETHSKRMANLAGSYHTELQDAGRDTAHTPVECEANTQSVLNAVPASQKLLPDSFPSLAAPVKLSEVECALSTAKSGTATGLDGLPYELWKKLNDHHQKATKLGTGELTFNVVAMLTAVFNDIQTHGLLPDSTLSQGWMCPIYKKNDKTEIANYRPITLLNTDYKIFTKVLASQLAAAVPQMIHTDQAGFIPGRSIFDQTRLAKAMISYAEAMDENGAIVALDQEKAYDKIDHTYLWRTLATFNLPDLFIRTVRSLYETAFTQVAVNGCFSAPYRVTRGVRQGDPLSCLLFDLAIEPLACLLRNSPKLLGYSIPGAPRPVLVSLFADDTALYLSSTDRYDDVLEILDSWCRASGAKFNINKTEIVPIGSLAHRDRVRTTRCIHINDRHVLDPGVNVAGEGRPIRYLSLWMGNKVDDANTWSLILDKVRTAIARWQLSPLTLAGKRLVVQLIVGGLTQFPTKVQGMPIRVEKELIRIIRNFIWDDNKHPPLAMQYLYRPPAEGGIGLLDVKARNDAIQLMWLRSYLNLSPSRPMWAFVTDVLINNAAPARINDLVKMNIFLQTWHIPLQGQTSTHLPVDLCTMLRTARKYNVNFAALKLTKDLQIQLPAWFLLGATSHRLGEKAQCLQQHHHIRTIADLASTARRLAAPTIPPHKNTLRCRCTACRLDRAAGCLNPNHCALEAVAILNTLRPKFDPRIDALPDGLTLTHCRRSANIHAYAAHGEILFDPTMSCKDTLAECFCVFTDVAVAFHDPPSRLAAPAGGVSLPNERIIFYTDGSCLNNGKANARCGAGIWVDYNHPFNRSIRVPGSAQSNQVGELVAVLVAVQTAPNFAPILIRTDSRYVIDGLTKHLTSWENHGWIGVANAQLFQATAYHLRRRSAPSAFQWVKGHNGDLGNECADTLAREGVEKPLFDEIDLFVPAPFRLQGAQILELTQALAYHGVRSFDEPDDRTSTELNLATAIAALFDFSGHLETSATIWEGCLCTDLRLVIRQFLFRILHELYRVGTFWLRVTAHINRAICPVCDDTTESMGHILTECSTPAVHLVWSLAEDLWPYHPSTWPPITFGTILSVGCLTVPADPDSPAIVWPPSIAPNPLPAPPAARVHRGASRLLRILISESAYLLWLFRNERILSNRTHTASEITRRWTYAIEERLKTDRYASKHFTTSPHALNLLRSTWSRVLAAPPSEWHLSPEVLVGLRPPTFLP